MIALPLDIDFQVAGAESLPGPPAAAMEAVEPVSRQFTAVRLGVAGTEVIDRRYPIEPAPRHRRPLGSPDGERPTT